MRTSRLPAAVLPLSCLAAVACGGGANSEPEALPTPQTLSSGEEVVLLPA